jgi:ribonuclease HI
MAVWLVRCGYSSVALNHGVAAVGWDLDVSAAGTIEDIEALYRMKWPDARRTGSSVRCIWDFLHTIRDGDFVVMPSKAGDELWLGKVTGPFKYRMDLPGGVRMTRPVRWLVRRALLAVNDAGLGAALSGQRLRVQPLYEGVLASFCDSEGAGPEAGILSSGAVADMEGAFEEPPPRFSSEPQAPTEALKRIVAYTDGACIGNPGPGGYGVVLRYGTYRREISGGYRKTTNNRMELLAAIRALEALKERCNVTLYSDSQYLVRMMQGEWPRKWRANGWWRSKKEKASNPDLWETLLALCDEHRVEFIWIKGHAGDAENERCDQLAMGAALQSNLWPDEGYESALAGDVKGTLHQTES